jgi:multidrug resistance protein, MATE family
LWTIDIMMNLLKLILPVVLSYLGIMTMGIVDVWYVGRVSVEAVGAVGIGSSIFGWFLVFGLGVLSCLEYLVSHAQGAKESQRQHQLLFQGLILSILISVPLTLGLVLGAGHLKFLGIHPSVLPLAQEYLSLLSWSMIFVLVFSVFRLYLTALGLATPGLVILVLANVMNALGNYILVWGRWGSPAYGVVGSAWTTVISRFVMMIALGFYVWGYERKRHHAFSLQEIRNNFVIDRPLMKEFFHLGLPAGLQLTFEAGVFALATTLAARLTPAALAAHQIVLNMASFTFMVPLGIGSAAAVRVGNALGRQSHHEAIKVGWRSLALGAGFMACSGLVFFLFGKSVLHFFTSDPEVIELGQQIFLIAAFFQIADGVQTVGTGSLRGLGDTRSSMVFNLLGHWAIGLPVGGSLCFYFHQGLTGLWFGLSLGLILVAIAILFRWRQKSKELFHSH